MKKGMVSSDQIFLRSCGYPQGRILSGGRVTLVWGLQALKILCKRTLPQTSKVPAAHHVCFQVLFLETYIDQLGNDSQKVGLNGKMAKQKFAYANLLKGESLNNSLKNNYSPSIFSNPCRGFLCFSEMTNLLLGVLEGFL